MVQLIILPTLKQKTIWRESLPVSIPLILYTRLVTGFIVISHEISSYCCFSCIGVSLIINNKLKAYTINPVK